MFLLARATGDPIELLLPAEATVQDREFLIQKLGLDKPLPEQYYLFMTRTLSGQFEDSIRYGRPAIELFLQRFPNSLKLIAVAFIFGYGVAVPLGVIAGSRRGSFSDQVARLIAVIGIATPGFWLGLMLIYIVGVGLGWLPVARMGGTTHYILPAFTLAFRLLAGVARLLRSSMIEVLDSEFVKLARIKGVSRNMVLYRHALRNAVIPALSLAGMQVALLLGGTVVIETVFAWPGSGRLVYEGIIYRDYPLVQTVVLLKGTFIIGTNFLIDILYSYVDPRIRYA